MISMNAKCDLRTQHLLTQTLTAYDSRDLVRRKDNSGYLKRVPSLKQELEELDYHVTSNAHITGGRNSSKTEVISKFFSWLYVCKFSLYLSSLLPNPNAMQEVKSDTHGLLYPYNLHILSLIIV